MVSAVTLAGSSLVLVHQNGTDTYLAAEAAPGVLYQRLMNMADEALRSAAFDTTVPESEVGLSGGNDPNCRIAMEWDEEKQEKELFAYYKKLIGIRRESPSLLRGDFRTCLCDDASNVYAFRRTYGEEETLVVLNAGNEPVKTKIAAEGAWTPRISGRKIVSSESGEIVIDVAPCSAEIYQKKAKGRK